MFNRYIFLLCAGFLSSFSHGLPSEDGFERLYFRSFEQGNLQGGITEICRDRNGFVWVLSKGSVYRLDGNTNSEYRIRDANGIFQRIISIIADGNGDIWTATSQQIYRYCWNRNRFEPILTKAELEGTQNFIGLKNLGEPFVWAIRANSLHQIETTSLKVKDHYDQGKENHFTDLTKDQSGNYWCGSRLPGIVHFDIEKGRFEYIENPDEGKAFREVFVDSNDQIWIGNRKWGLSRYLPRERAFKSFELGDASGGKNPVLLTDVLEYPKGQLLVSTDQGGLFRVNLETGERLSLKEGDRVLGNLSSDGCTDLYVDDEENLWVGHSQKGIDLHSPRFKKFRSIVPERFDDENSLIYDVVGSLFEDSRGLLWIGTDGGGISIMNPKNYRFTNIPKDDKRLSSGVIRSIAEDSQGRMWIASWNGGVVVLELADGAWKRVSDYDEALEQFKGMLIWSAAIDYQDCLWVAYQNGEIVQWNPERGEKKVWIERNFEQTTKNPVLSRFKDQIYLKWRNRFYLYGPDHEDLREIKGIPGLKSIHIWDGSYECYGVASKGFFHTKQIETDFVFEKHGESFRGNKFKDVRVDRNGSFWASMSDGLLFYDPIKKINRYYDKSDGLPSDNFFRESSLVLRSGELCFGSTNGLLIFDPNEIRDNTRPPSLHLNNVFINNEKVDELMSDDEIYHIQAIPSLLLNWKQKDLRLDFSAINVSNTKNLRYRYQLKGFDAKPRYVTFEKLFLNYNNLKAGDYELVVNVSNEDGIWADKDYSLKISLSPPFWEKLWFRALVATTIVALILFLHFWREKQLQRQNRLLEHRVAKRTQIIQDQHDKLEAQSQELMEHKRHLEEMVDERTQKYLEQKVKAERSDRVKTMFLENLSHEIRTPLNALMGFSQVFGSEELNEEERVEYSSIVKSSTDDLTHMIDSILELSLIGSGVRKFRKNWVGVDDFADTVFYQAQAKNTNHHINLAFENKIEGQGYQLYTHEAYLLRVVFNLVDNALKFSSYGVVEFGVLSAGEQLIFWVEDQGAGIPESEFEHIFDTFFRLEVDQKQAKRGVGIGLSFVRGLSDILGYQIKLNSKLGEGSRFELIFCGSYVSREQENALGIL